MPRLSVQDAVQKWKTNTTSPAAMQYYQTGVRNPRKDWESATVAAESKWQAGIARAIQLGRRVRGVQAAGTSFWQSQTLAKQANWQAGVQSAGPKVTSGFQRLYGYLSTADSATSGMPTDTRAQRIGKAAAYMTAVGDAHDADTSRP